MRRFLRNPKIAVPAAVAALALAAWVAFGWFGVHLLFVDDRVDEAPPVFAAAPAATTAPPATAPTTAPTTATVPPTPAPPSPLPGGDAATPTVPPATAPATTAPSTTAAAPQVVVERQGTFESRDHPTSGTALVLGNGSDQRFLRFEGFETDNGPDLNVYLVNRAAGGVSDHVDLGDLKGNIGDQNYEIPAGVDLSVYDSVVIWCVRFSSPFGEAILS